MTTPGIRAVFFLAIAAVALVGGGILLGAYFETPEEASLRQPPAVVPVTDPVRSEVLERSITLRGTPAPAERDVPRFVPGILGRVVTAVDVERGVELRPGSVLLEVEGRPVIVLSGAFPMWRDLTWPTSAGPDIAQLQSALAELGLYHAEISGKYEAATLLAVFDLYESIGYEPPSRSAVHHQEFVFVARELSVVERFDLQIGDALRADAITLASAARRIEAELTVDQRAALVPGLIVRAAGSSPAASWSGTIGRLVDIPRTDGMAGPNAAIEIRESIPESLTGENVFEVVLAATDGPVLSAAAAAVHVTDTGDLFVVVLDGTAETPSIPVTVGVITASRVEIRPLDSGALRPGDALVLDRAR